MIDFSTITIDGKDYNLSFPLGAMLDAERRIGKPLQVFFAQDTNKIPTYTTAEFVILFRIGLKTNYPNLTDEQKDSLLATFFQEGDSLAQQQAILYVLLGQAVGFFRGAGEVQKKVTEKNGARKTNNPK